MPSTIIEPEQPDDDAFKAKLNEIKNRVRIGSDGYPMYSPTNPHFVQRKESAETDNSSPFHQTLLALLEVGDALWKLQRKQSPKPIRWLLRKPDINPITIHRAYVPGLHQAWVVFTSPNPFMDRSVSLTYTNTDEGRVTNYVAICIIEPRFDQAGGIQLTYDADSSIIVNEGNQEQNMPEIREAKNITQGTRDALNKLIKTGKAF